MKKSKEDPTASTDMIQDVKDIVDDPSGSLPGSSDRWLWRSRMKYSSQSWKDGVLKGEFERCQKLWIGSAIREKAK